MDLSPRQAALCLDSHEEYPGVTASLPGCGTQEAQRARTNQALAQRDCMLRMCGNG